MTLEDLRDEIKSNVSLYINHAYSCRTWAVTLPPFQSPTQCLYANFPIPIEIGHKSIEFGSKWGKSRDFSTSRRLSSAYLCMEPGAGFLPGISQVVCG